MVCTNKLIGIGPQLSDDAAKEISQMWGSDPVHPSMALATAIERDVLIDDVKYINDPKSHGDSAAKKQRQTYADQGKAGSSSALRWYRDGTQLLPAGDTAAGATEVPVTDPKPGNGKPGVAAGEGEGGRMNRATLPAMIINGIFCHKPYATLAGNLLIRLHIL